jgi:AcrR family transcriptional regulator
MKKTTTKTRRMANTSKQNSVAASGPRDATHPRKQQIFAAFRRVLIRDGHASASVRAIAGECGMKLGHLQYYFNTRDELVSAFIDSWISREQSGRNVLVNTASSPREALMIAMDGAYEHLCLRGFQNTLAALELWSMAAHDETVRTKMQHWQVRERTYYGKLIRDAVPGLGASEAENRALSILATLEGIAIHVALTSDRDTAAIETGRKLVANATRRMLDDPVGPAGS